MIEVEHLTKTYGRTVAVDDLSFTVRPGRVTGLVGPNGAGKSTTLRMVLGLAAPTAGRATVAGRPYAALDRPLTTVGALLDARATYGRRSARDHLRVLAASQGLPTERVDAVLARVGLADVAHRHTRTFSLGMAQRLGLAAALVGDPAVLVLDEPLNGLDPEGVVWFRDVVRGLADEGRTVLVSSHLMGEMARTADHVVVLARGRLLADEGLAQFVARHGGDRVQVRVREPAELCRALARRGIEAAARPDGVVDVRGADPEHVGEVAHGEGLTVLGLSGSSSLEDAFLRLTGELTDYRTTGTTEVPR